MINIDNNLTNYNVNNLNLGEIKGLELDICKFISSKLYEEVTTSLLSEMINFLVGYLEKPVAMDDYYNNLLQIKKELSEFINFKMRFEKELYEKKIEFGIIVPKDVQAESLTLLKEYEIFIDYCLSFYRIMRKVSNITQIEDNKNIYVSEIESQNKKAIKQLKTISQFANNNLHESIIQNPEIYNSLILEFVNLTLNMSASNLEKVEQPKINKVKKNEISLAEKKRIEAIQKANNLFEEFKLDFLRDLQNQYALSSKDLYENFINGKFKKFMDKYSFPLDNNVSEGYANECISQIYRLIDMVSDISANSYVTSVFEK